MNLRVKKKWDIRLEPCGDGVSFDVKTGKLAPVDKAAVRVKYRKIGSKGRFETFVAMTGIPSGVDVQDLVTRYDEERRTG